MARRPRLQIPGLPHHVIQRGNNRTDIFRADSDREFFLVTLRSAAVRYELDVHVYTLMTNHIHLLATPRTTCSLSRTMQTVGRKYVRYFNRRYSRTGGLYEGRYRSTVIDSQSYWFSCMRYVELNPVRAGIVATPDAYRWSSYPCHAHGAPDVLIVAHPVYLSLGSSPAIRQQHWRAICGEAVPEEQLVEIRDAIHYGGILGNQLNEDKT